MFTTAWMQINSEFVFFKNFCCFLMSEMSTHGIRGLTHQLLRSYLEKRLQYVTINSTNSSASPIGMGVSQGDNVGPLLFLVFINNIVKSISQLNFNLFADETRIYLSGWNEFTLYNVMDAELRGPTRQNGSKCRIFFIGEKLSLGSGWSQI